VIALGKVTRKDVEKTIKRCLKNKDNKTASNYYNSYKQLFNDLDLDKLKDEINKPNRRVENKIEEKEGIKESKEE